jgi:4-hydroxybenzoate polyprenyltransferase
MASGALPLPVGLAAIPVCLGASAVVATILPLNFAAVLGLYVILTTAYSLRLKQIPLLDVFCLACLYTLRLIGGHEATGVAYSFWLLAFSMFIFLSLALVKRYLEIAVTRDQPNGEIRGRGYAPGDAGIVSILGCSSGYLAALVLALYVNSQDVVVLYRHPTLLLLICPLLLFWISRVWLLAHRGQVNQDPVVFAITDKTSYLIGILSVLVIYWAS